MMFSVFFLSLVFFSRFRVIHFSLDIKYEPEIFIVKKVNKKKYNNESNSRSMLEGAREKN